MNLKNILTCLCCKKSVTEYSRKNKNTLAWSYCKKCKLNYHIQSGEFEVYDKNDNPIGYEDKEYIIASKYMYAQRTIAKTRYAYMEWEFDENLNVYSVRFKDPWYNYIDFPKNTPLTFSKKDLFKKLQIMNTFS